MARPAAAAEKPFTYCMYCEFTKNSANRPKNVVPVPSTATLSRRDRNTRGSMSGCGDRRECQISPASSTAPSAKPASTSAEPQPCEGPSMIPYRTAVDPAVSSIAPSGS
ncbi:hypothetical protein JMUB6875_33740 [Nocardia sp. JMUB6875]